MKPDLDTDGLDETFRRQDARRRRLVGELTEPPLPTGAPMNLDAATLAEIGAILERHDAARQAVLAVAKLLGRTATPADPVATLVRIFAGQSDSSERAWALERMTAFLLGRGALSLERCLHLPASSTGWARALRNHWLQRAALLIETPLLTVKAATLARELDRFRRFQWPAWQRMSTPPSDASAIDGVLFFCLRSADGLVRVDLQWRQLRKIIGPIAQFSAREGNEGSPH